MRLKDQYVQLYAYVDHIDRVFLSNVHSRFFEDSVHL